MGHRLPKSAGWLGAAMLFCASSAGAASVRNRLNQPLSINCGNRTVRLAPKGTVSVPDEMVASCVKLKALLANGSVAIESGRKK